MEQITRKQLIGYGASRHHAKTLTQSLDPAGKDGNADAYSVRDVIASIREYLKRSQVKAGTRQTLESVLAALLEYLGNTTEAPFGQSQDSELADSTKQLAQAMARTDSSLKEMKATAAKIRAKYKS
jgi:membrane-bound lytic murein transglycosylase B